MLSIPTELDEICGDETSEQQTRIERQLLLQSPRPTIIESVHCFEFSRRDSSILTATSENAERCAEECIAKERQIVSKRVVGPFFFRQTAGAGHTRLPCGYDPPRLRLIFLRKGVTVGNVVFDCLPQFE